MGKVSWKGIKTPERTLQWKIDVYKMQNNMARGIFAEKRGVLIEGKGDFERHGKRQKEKRPMSRTLLLFFVVYDVLYSISTGLIPERIQLRF